MLTPKKGSLKSPKLLICCQLDFHPLPSSVCTEYLSFPRKGPFLTPGANLTEAGRISVILLQHSSYSCFLLKNLVAWNPRTWWLSYYYWACCSTSTNGSSTFRISTPSAHGSLLKRLSTILRQATLTKDCAGRDRLSVEPKRHLWQNHSHDTWQVGLDHKVANFSLEMKMGCHDNIFSWRERE